MTFEEFESGTVAVWLVTEQRDGSFEQSWFAGRPSLQQERFCITQSSADPFCLPLDAIEDVQRSNEAQQAVFEGAEFFIRLVIKLQPDDLDASELEFTGLRLRP